jgi:hypothetical protein
MKTEEKLESIVAYFGPHRPHDTHDLRNTARALLDVLRAHKPIEIGGPGSSWDAGTMWCETCEERSPCETVEAIEKHMGDK